jgi:hypothetical protein
MWLNNITQKEHLIKNIPEITPRSGNGSRNFGFWAGSRQEASLFFAETGWAPLGGKGPSKRIMEGGPEGYIQR